MSLKNTGIRMKDKVLLFINGDPPRSFPNLENYNLIACTDGAFHYLKDFHFPLIKFVNYSCRKWCLWADNCKAVVFLGKICKLVNIICLDWNVVFGSTVSWRRKDFVNFW